MAVNFSALESYHSTHDSYRQLKKIRPKKKKTIQIIKSQVRQLFEGFQVHPLLFLRVYLMIGNQSLFGPFAFIDR